MTSTKLLYLEDFTKLEGEGSVVDVLRENDKDVVVLDQTILYPQGGGQPYDQGMIELGDVKFKVEEVRFVDGIVKHIGVLENGTFQKGEAVKCFIDKDRRFLNSRLHSAGHVVDMAMRQVAPEWIPAKGYHFPDGPYVEYMATLEGKDKEDLKKKLEKLCNTFIKVGREVKVAFMSTDEMKSVCHFVPDYIPKDKPSRVVMFGDFGIPCGGTHVKNISEIQSMSIRKIKANGKDVVRVGYDISR